MSRRKFPTDVIKQAQNVVKAWDQISPAPAFGALTVGSLNSDVTTAAALEGQVVALEAQLAEKRVACDLQFQTLWNNTKRARNSIKGSFGDDSPEYKMVGGTRLSERKPPRRKTAESKKKRLPLSSGRRLLF
jgi:hypothetical protein